MNTKSSLANSFKWSALSELTVKLITPVLNSILSRILLPDDYAPLTTIMMLISFCEIFVESGFKKYLIQHDFKDEEEEKLAFHVAYWTTLGVSLLIWIAIILFCKPISTFLGNSEIWLAVAVSGCILPMYAMTGVFITSIQKKLDFRKLFCVRVITALIPLFVTLPLAVIGLKYWSLVVGNLASVSTQCVVLKYQSKFKIEWGFCVRLLRKMLSDTIWNMVDGIAVWLTAWLDSLIITHLMSDYHLGLYKNSLNTVTSLFSIITAAVGPVLFVGLTKNQNDEKKFSDLFIEVQQTLAMLLLPIGIGVYLYRDLAVTVLFGNRWGEAANIVGITALTLALRTVYVSICSDVYRAKGVYKIPLILQIADLCLLVPTCLISAQYGFWQLVYARAFVRIALVIPEIFVLKRFAHIDMKKQISMQWPVFFSTVVMAICCFILKELNEHVIWKIITIVIAIIVYSLILLTFSATRKQIQKYIKKYIKKKGAKNAVN